MKMFFKRAMPASTWLALRRIRHTAAKSFRKMVEAMGFIVARKSDYYTPLPSEFELRKSVRRWNRPSSLQGVQYDLDSIKKRFTNLCSPVMLEEFSKLEPYERLVRHGFGPGFPHLDGLVLYAMMREQKPKRYLEVGSGLSTYYCSLACEKNSTQGSTTQITCIEPYPFAALRKIQGINVIEKMVQDVSPELFTQLEAGDVLFIDSSHAIRIDSDVPFLFLEILPLLKPGVRVHIHDVPFPFNTPFPAEFWVLTEDPIKSGHWPIFWNEAMLVQAFLSFNSHFQIELSAPMLRHFDEAFLRKTVPFYKPISEEPNTFSSLWLLRS